MKGRIVVYSIVGCPHCIAAKSSLRSLGLKFDDISLSSYDASVRQALRERTQKSSVPQIFFNSYFVGGNAELQELIKDQEKFNELLKDVEENEPGDDAPRLPDASLAKSQQTVEFTCERDEIMDLVQQIKNSGILKRHKTGIFSSEPSSFKSTDLLKWLVSEKQMTSDEATSIADSLVSTHLIYNIKDKISTFTKISSDGIYRFYDEGSVTGEALNKGPLPECRPLPPSEIGNVLRQMILEIYAEFLSSDGKRVDYAGIKTSEKFKKYVELSQQLQRTPIESASREEKLAFFINLYNALVIHGYVVLGAPEGMWSRWRFFNRVAYIVGGQRYSLQDIENGVLRANRKGVGMLFKPFGLHDPRLPVALTEPEPMIHAALVCGAKSCPPIKTFSAENIMSELKEATAAFLESEDAANVHSDRRVMLSMIFKWYRSDFGQTDREVLEWILQRTPPGDNQEKLKELLSKSESPRIQYMPYDWSHNSK